MIKEAVLEKLSKINFFQKKILFSGACLNQEKMLLEGFICRKKYNKINLSPL